MYGYIYITENLIDHKKYIGQHKASRFDKRYKGSGKIIKKALLKYGFNNFVCHILESDGLMPTMCNSAEELNLSEQYYIELYDCVNSSEYYNLVSGGGHNDSYSTLTDEEKIIRNKKISEKLTGRVFSDEWRAKISEQAKKRIGEKNSNYGNTKLKDRYASGDYVSPCLGKKHSEEYKQKLSQRCKELGINKGSKSANFGKHWFTDGKHSIQCFEQDCPVGWHRGRTIVKEL